VGLQGIPRDAAHVIGVAGERITDPQSPVVHTRASQIGRGGGRERRARVHSLLSRYVDYT
jgi:hypothetical protein